MKEPTKREFLNKTKKQFYQEVKKYQQKLPISKEIEGFPSNAIVGEKGYPNLRVHSSSNPSKEGSFFNNSESVKKDYQEILPTKARNILGSTHNLNIKKVDDKIKKEIEDVYKSRKPVQIHSKFEKEIRFNNFLINPTNGIIGSRNPLENLYATENTKTSKVLEKHTGNEIKAQKSLIDLYEKGINESQIINLFSFGSFGTSINEKLVPSRWAISGYDSTIENHLFNKIKEYPITNKYKVYGYSDKGNFFLIILFPTLYYSSVIEKFPGAVKEDFTNSYNRLDKKEPATSGGYWATKLAVLEKLREMKRQASFISIRIIRDYDLPLGVIFVRETVRETMKREIFSTNSEEELIDFLKNFNEELFLFTNSKFNKERNRKTLNEFF